MSNSLSLGSGSEWAKPASGLNAEDPGANQKSASEATSFKQTSNGYEQPRRGGPPSFFNSKKEGSTTAPTDPVPVKTGPSQVSTWAASVASQGDDGANCK